VFRLLSDGGKEDREPGEGFVEIREPGRGVATRATMNCVRAEQIMNEMRHNTRSGIYSYQ